MLIFFGAIAILLYKIMLKTKIANDVLLTDWCIFPHEKLEHFLNRFMGIYLDWIQTDIIPNEMFKFIR